MIAGRRLAARHEDDDRRADQPGEREQLPGLKRVGPEPEIAPNATQSRSRSSSSRRAFSAGSIAASPPPAPAAAGRDQRRAVKTIADERRRRRRRYGSSHARRLKPSSIGAASDVLAAELLDERREDLRRGPCPSASIAISARASARRSRGSWHSSGSLRAVPRMQHAARAHDLALERRCATPAVRSAATRSCLRVTPRRRTARSASSSSDVGRRVAPARCATAKANAVSGSSAMSVPSARMPKPNQTQFTSGLTTTSTLAVCSPRRTRQHDVEVLGERAADRHFGRRLDPRACGRTTCAGYIFASSSPSRSTVMCAVIICFWPSSVTCSASRRTAKSPTVDLLPGLEQHLSRPA